MSKLYALITKSMSKDKTARGSSQIEVIAKNFDYKVSTTILSKGGGERDIVIISVCNMNTGETRDIVEADFRSIMNPDPIQSLIDSTNQLTKLSGTRSTCEPVS